MTLALLGFGAAVAFWPGWLSAATAPRWALLAAGVPFVRGIHAPLLGAQALPLLGIVCGWMAASLLWTPDTLFGCHEAFHLLILVGVALAASAVSDISGVLVATAWGVAISSLLAIAQVFGWSPVEQVTVPSGLFYNKALLAEAAAPLIVWAALSRRWYLAATLLPALALTQSRAAIVAAVCGAILSRPRLAKWLLPALGVGLLVALTDINLYSAVARAEIWATTIAGMSVLGHGIGSFSAVYPWWNHAHSDLLQIGFELGIVGTAGLCGFFAVALKGPASPVRIALAVAAVEAIVSFPLHQPMAGFLAFLLAGHLVCERSRVCGGAADG